MYSFGAGHGINKIIAAYIVFESRAAKNIGETQSSTTSREVVLLWQYILGAHTPTDEETV